MASKVDIRTTLFGSSVTLLAVALLAGCMSTSAPVAALPPLASSSAGLSAPEPSSAAPLPPSTPPAASPGRSRVPKPTLRATRSPANRTSTVRYVADEPIPHGCWTVGPSLTGIKVYLVQRALHLVGHRERYDAATASAVRSFQRADKLAVTGLVDATTWAALRTGYDFCVDRYTQQPVVPVTASAAARVGAEIGYASARLGRPYVWGGAGPMGFDCSGLVLQSLYAAGVLVPGINTDLHVQADFRTTQALYASRLPHVPFSQRRRGDLIFYGSPISHMAIYLGGGKIIEAVRPGIRTASLWADGLPAQPYVVRPFPG
jgi:cell wall-associated NlpC family hydrolase